MKLWALAAASGMLGVLVFPDFQLVWLAPLCLVPLLVALDGSQSHRQRFALGLVAGFVYWFGVCYWIQDVLAQYGGLGTAGAWAVFLLFCLAKGMHWAVFGLAAGCVIGRPWAIPAVAAIWTGIERTNGSFGFAWLCLGNAGIDMGIPMRLAPIAGVYGMSFVFAMMNAAVALVILRRRRLELAPLLALPPLFLLPAIPDTQVGKEIAVVVQPNIEEKQEWTAEGLEETIRRLGWLSLDEAATKRPLPDLILWPEVPAPFYWDRDPLLRDQAQQLARVTKSNFLFGAVARTPQGGALNSVHMLGPDGSYVDRYDKINLVPFGEFIPPFFGFVQQISDEAGTFHPGARLINLPTSAHKLGTFICYEVVFPDFIRRFTASGAEVLLNLSNDGYFGRSAARGQHLLIARMRAAENRRWLIRATNDGITATIDPTGRVTQRLKPYVQMSARTTFGYRQDLTPYVQFGDWFAWSCLVLGAGAALAGWRRAG